MRYDDASGAFQASGPIANDDADTLSAGQRGPATGNLITGEGTQYGSAGADSAAGGHIVAIAGKGGEDTSFAGGKLSVTGEHGRLTVDAEGNYSYLANGNLENVRDRFTYTLADSQGNSDTAALIVEIGKTPAVIKANAQQIVPGPDGVVTLPPGVELSDIRVVGRNLVVDLPDGTQLIILDGAIFVPQLVLGGVEVPATNVAALLIGQEPQPAAGETPPSSGGNFALPPPPLDPGVPLGDLIPPTEYDYTPPEPEEVLDILNREPEIFIQPDGQPASVAAVDEVEEAGLPTRNGGEPAGSGESADGNGTDNDVTSEATAGNIIYDSPDGVASITLNGVVISSVGQVINGAFGTVTITSIAPGVIGYRYTLLDNTSGNDTHDDFEVVLTDEDGDVASATLRIDIVDDVPTARPDTDAIAAGQFGPATGNVMTDAAAGDAGDSDTNAADTVGADNASVTSISGAGGSDSTFTAGQLQVNGQYGVLTMDAQGNYSYTRNPGTPGGVNDVFNYTLTDGDGDTSTTTLTISIGDATPLTGQNPTALLDDDALPGGIAGGVGDDVDAANLSGNLAASGGDGPLSFDLLLTGAPAGFTYVDGPGGSVLVQQGGVTVLTITVNAATGAYTVTQNAPIDHPAGGDENNVSFTINYRVTDQDGDTADGTLSINVDDDTPTMTRADVSLPTLAVDETDLAANASASFASVFAGAYGADGPGTTSYAVSVVNGTDSGLVDVATGQSIFLFNNAGVVEGRVGGAAGAVAFTVSVNSGTGLVTLDQVRALDHPVNPNPDDPVSPNASSIQLTATIVDGDGDPASLAVNIGGSLVFEDDGPSVNPALNASATVTVDESLPSSDPGINTGGIAKGDDPDLAGGLALGQANSGAAIVNANAVFGADGPAAGGGISYALSITNANPGVTLTDGTSITMQLVGGVIVGVVDAGPFAGQAAFAIAIDPTTGVVTVEQYLSLDHPVNPDPNDPLGLGDNSVAVTVTATDGDGDPVTSGAVDISGQITFLDDGPTVNPTLNAQATVTVDESLPSTAPAIDTGGVAKGDDPDLAGGLALGQANSGVAIVDANAVFGADGPGAGGGIAYALSISNAASGVTLTDGSAINLQLVGGVIVGVVASGPFAGQAAFAIAINSTTGVVSVEQYLSLDHPVNPDPNDPLGLGANTVAVTVTATDGDGDPVTSGAVDISGQITFLDDGPTTDPVLDREATVTVDESLPSSDPGINTGGIAKGDDPDLAGELALGQANSGVAIVDANAVFGADGPAAGGGISYALSITNANPGVTLTDGTSITMQLVGGVIVGVVDAGPFAGQAAFAIAIDPSTGVVSVEQYLSLDHPVNPDPNDPLGLGENSVAVTVTATDGDGDPVTSGAVDISDRITFLDDGPSVDITLSGAAEPTLTTQDTETDGTPTTQDSASANFAANFTVNLTAGADGPGTQSVSYALGVASQGVDSGLEQGGANIFLYLIGGVVVGSTSATQAGVNAGNTVFNVSVDAGGTVTLTQFSQIDHESDPSPTGSPFGDDVDSLADSLVTLTATVNVTDGDGDPASDSETLNIGANLQFQDDGPDVAAVLTGTLLKLDETDGVGVPGEVDAPGGNLGTITVAAASLFTVSQPNVSPDTPTTFSYSLSLSADGVASGLMQSTTNAPIFLYNIGGVITGSTSATLAGVNAGNTAFTVTIDSGSGAVTMTQFQAVEHFNTSSNDEDSSGLTSGVLSANVTATDFDGDTDSASVDLGSIIRFEDDGPTIDVSVNGQVTEPVLITQDAETDGVPTAQDSASSAANFGGVFNLAFTTGSDGAPTPTLSYALGVSAQGADSGLDSAGASIFLYNIGGVVVGSTSATQAGVNGSNTVFDLTVSASGVVTLTQYSQIDHPAGGDPSPTGSPFTDHVATLADSLVTLTASSTIVDNDGDPATDSATVNIGANLRFQDDGPDVAAALTGTLLKLDETDGVGVPGEVDPAGGNLGTITVNAATLVTVSQPNVSADTPTTLAYSLVLSSNGVNSGLMVSSNNAPIFLYNIGGVITGSTSATLAGVNAGNTAFTVSVNSGTGAVTMTQFLAVEHSNTASNDEDSSGLAAGALGLVVTATDFDGDTDSASVDLGSVIRFEDDGPSAENDVDVIVGGNGPATGNVMTGVEVAVAEDANNQDGVADNVGSDTPGSITNIDHASSPALAVPAGGSVNILGDHGTLTIYSNGDYSYLRTSGAGGVQDVFTYTLTDADGDSVTATLTISIEDNFPTLPDPADVLLDDDALAGGNAGGTGDDPDSQGLPGQLGGTGGDGDLDYNFTGLDTVPAGFTVNPVDASTVQILQGATVVLTITLNNETGAFNVVQNNPIDHLAGDNENNYEFEIGVEVEDADGDVEPATITINVDDDTPTINVTQNNEAGVLLTTQDADTIGVNTDTDSSTANFSGVFGLTSSAGADGGASPSLSYALAVTNSVSGLASHGAAINLFLIGGVVVGSTAADAGSVNAGNTIFDISVSGTGVVTLNQYQQIDHPLAGDPTPTGTPFADHILALANGKVTLTASSTITDGDGDQATDQEVIDLGGNIRFADDGPVAANDVVNQTTENQPVTFGVFGNDQFGADGVDTDNNPTVNVTFTQPPPGQGTVTYNAATGEFTFTPAPGQQGSTQFTYTIIDFDGDTSTATVTINLQPDSVPAAADGVAKVDDDGLPAGVGDNLSPGDLDANSGEAPVVNSSEAVWHGQLAATAGGDTIVDYDFASMHGTSGSVGTETVNYSWNNGTSTLTATISGGARNGLELFNVVVNQATGEYNLTLVNNVLHADEVANQENDATTNLTFTVTDSDGDTDTGTIAVTFDDDMPVVTSVTDPLNIDNDATPSGTGNFAFDIGADQNADFDDITVSNFTVSVNGLAIDPGDVTFTPGAETATTASYSFSFDYDSGTGGIKTATGTLVFNKAAGTYTVELTNGPISGFTIDDLAGVDAGSFVGHDAPGQGGGSDEIVVAPFAEDLFVQFTGHARPTNGSTLLQTEDYEEISPAPAPDGDPNNLFVAGELFTDNVASMPSVTVSNSDAGVNGNTIQTGEVIDFNLYETDPGATLGQTPTASASDMFIVFDNFDPGDDLIVILKLMDPDTGEFTTKAVIVNQGDYYMEPDAALLTGTAYEAIINAASFGNNDSLLVIESNDYNSGTENWVIVGAQVTNNHDGVTGTGINLNRGLGAGGASSGTESFATDTDVSNLKISNIGFVRESTTDQSATIEFDVTVEDADGDQVVTQDVTVNIGDPVAPAQLPFSSQSEQLQKTAANSNTLTMAAAVAAAGMAESAAAESSPANDQPSDNSDPQVYTTQVVEKAYADDGGDGSSSAVAPPEAQEAEAAPGNSGGHGNGNANGHDNQLDAGSNDQSSDEGSSKQAANDDHGPATAEPQVASPPAVAMVSAEQLQAAGVEGNAQHGGSVEKIVADALGEGGAPTLDDVLANLPGGIGELAAIANLASDGGHGVPAWDMGMHGSFGPGADMLIKVAAVELHHDAVQPVA